METKTGKYVDLCIVHIHIVRENTNKMIFTHQFVFRILKRTYSPSYFKFHNNYYCTYTILFYIEHKIIFFRQLHI